MTENRRYGMLHPHPELTLCQILQEAHHRWLRPTEICEILHNYRKFNLTPDPPQKPQSGSLFLFDRKALRYFRKDGHNWRKKKDGKTVREAHERLKVGSVDVLHCYYAHGENNENFQRRCYWLLEGAYEHIVLVHYREVKEGSRSGTMHALNGHSVDVTATAMAAVPSPQTSPFFSPEASPRISSSSTNTVDWNGHACESEGPAADSSDETEPYTMFEEQRASLYQSSNGALQSCTSFSINNTAFACGEPETSNSLYNNNNNNNAKALEALVSHVENKMDNVELVGANKFYPKQLQLPGGRFNSMEWSNILRHGTILYDGFDKHETTDAPSWTDVLGHGSALQQHGLLEAVVASSIVPPSHHNVDTDAESGTKSSNICYLQGTHGTPLDNGARTDTAHINETSKELANLLSERLVKTEVVFDQEVNNRQGPNGHFGSLGTGKAVSADVQQLESHSHFHELHSEEAVPKQDNLSFPNEFGAHDGLNTSQFFPDFQVESPSQCGNLKKLDSFGRWMNQEIGDGENSLLTVSSDSGTYWQGTLDDQNAAEEVTSLSQQMQYDVGMRLSLSQKQYFSIIDYSPDHASSKGGTKVLLSVVFLEALKDPSECQWCCMFGEVEVAAELISPGVLRCKAPPHVPGRVPFYITRSDRAACSEVREFVYQEGDFTFPQGTSAEPQPDKKDEQLLQIRFARMLACSAIPFHQRNSKSKGKDETSSKFSLSLVTNQIAEEWSKLEDDYSTDALCKEILVRLLLKGMLHDWLGYRLEEEEKGASVLDEHGLGVIHMGAALGYDWVISPLLAAGVSINFRDFHGWTALHWAAYHGREKMVVALLASGAAPGAKSDPTPKYRAGQTPADLASLQKHKGIAGYLAESSLTTHLSLLKINGGKEEGLASAFEDEKAVVALAEKIVVETTCSQLEDELSLQDSLAAVRNSIQAAARIHAAFRAQSFRKRQENHKHKDEEDEYGISNGEAQAIVAAQKSYKSIKIYPDEAMHSAAVRIQQKFRGWKGRRDFLLFRQRVVKIQAHVRGHQVRKQYRKIVWSVSIVEKAILRWRRKGKGLRGFAAEANVIKEANKTKIDNDGEDDFLKVGRKQTEKGLENALARVQSMVKSREARDQYRRMLDGYQKAKEDFDADVSSRSNDESSQGEDSIMS